MNQSKKENHLFSLEPVRTDVFIANRPLRPSETENLDLLTAEDFGRAGVDAGKTANYGQGIMRDIALRMVGLENAQGEPQPHHYIERGTTEHDLYYRIFYLMNNPDLIQQGSRSQLLLGTQLVYDIWRSGEGDAMDRPLPIFGKVGHKIISMLFTEEAEARAELDEAQQVPKY